MTLRLQPILAILAFSALTACQGDARPAAGAAIPPDSSAGEVAQYALMRNRIGWLTDSNIVALANQVNDDARGIARLESQLWSKEAHRMVAVELLRDHARLQFAIDSLAALKNIPSQAPAIAPELKAPYDSLLNSQIGLPLAEREGQFLDMMLKVHARSITDFGALAGNASDPDLRALLATRAVLMEQTHVARVRMLSAAIAEADSIRQDSLKARGRGARP
jgi:hypothetical protein